MKAKLPNRPDDGGINVRIFRNEDYDAVVALWRRTEGIGLNESDKRPATVAFYAVIRA
jgi:hypothetical protein